MTTHSTVVNHPPLVEGLLEPRAYAHEVAGVRLEETHISWIFLTGEIVYKVKKPVNLGFLDFTALEERRRFCHREVELNRRLSPDIYLGVSEVRLDGARYTMDGPGTTVEYAVRMRQMPADRSLAALLRAGQVTEEDMRRIAARIAAFHATAETSDEITRAGGLETLRGNIRENFRQVARFIGTRITEAQLDDIRAFSEAFLEANRDLLQQRATAGRIRDGHGDIHTEQVYLIDGAVHFLDCIEFNDRLRYGDVVQDVAFLAMDLEYRWNTDLAHACINAYVEQTGDTGIWQVLPLFLCYRAFVRGKVACLRAEGAASDTARDEAVADAQAHFALAAQYAHPFPKPALVLVGGLMGSGKSTVAQALARRWDLASVSSDVLRKELAQRPRESQEHEAFGQGMYSAAFTAQTYHALLDKALALVVHGDRSVVVDATFLRAAHRQRAAAIAREECIPLWFIECVLPEDETRRRLERRASEPGAVSEGRWELHRAQQAQWEPVTEIAPERTIQLDTSGSPDETVARAMAAVHRRAAQIAAA